MKIMAFERSGSTSWPEQAQTERLLAAEAHQVWDLQQAGVIREIYFRADRNDAVLVLECRDEPEARRALASLPLVKEALIDFDIVPLRPYPGFARLFAAPDSVAPSAASAQPPPPIGR